MPWRCVHGGRPSEKTHIGYGHVKLKGMVNTDPGRIQAQEALDRWYPKGLDMFGDDLSEGGGAGAWLL